MPRLEQQGDGYKIIVETDTNARMTAFISLLREFYKKENLPAQKFEPERMCTLESKYFND